MQNFFNRLVLFSIELDVLLNGCILFIDYLNDLLEQEIDVLCVIKALYLGT